jgi:hypothetical protein
MNNEQLLSKAIALMVVLLSTWYFRKLFDGKTDEYKSKVVGKVALWWFLGGAILLLCLFLIDTARKSTESPETQLRGSQNRPVSREP